MMPPLASEPNFSIRLAGDAAVRDIGKVTEIGEAFPGSIVASVHAEEEQARNRLALAYANALGDICEFEVDSDIVQCNRANHANASARQRLARVGRS